MLKSVKSTLQRRAPDYLPDCIVMVEYWEGGGDWVKSWPTKVKTRAVPASVDTGTKITN